MKVRLVVAAALLVAALSPGAAAALSPVPPPATPAPPAQPKPRAATPEEIAAAKAEAEALLQRTGLGDVFEAIEDGKAPAVRHKGSGLVCALSGEADGGLHIFPGSARGEDISCGSRLLNIAITMYATRYPRQPTAQQVVDNSIEAMKLHIKKLKPYTGMSLNVSAGADAGLPKPVTVRMQGKIDGGDVYTRSSAVVIGDWVIAQRVTSPLADSVTADLIAEIKLGAAVMRLAGEPPVDAPPAPLPATPAVPASTT